MFSSSWLVRKILSFGQSHFDELFSALLSRCLMISRSESLPCETRGLSKLLFRTKSMATISIDWFSINVFNYMFLESYWRQMACDSFDGTSPLLIVMNMELWGGLFTYVYAVFFLYLLNKPWSRTSQRNSLEIWPRFHQPSFDNKKHYKTSFVSRTDKRDDYSLIERIQGKFICLIELATKSNSAITD